MIQDNCPTSYFEWHGVLDNYKKTNYFEWRGVLDKYKKAHTRHNISTAEMCILRQMSSKTHND